MRIQTRIRKARREKGLCASIGCPVVTGDCYLCDEHALKQAEYSRSYRARKRALRQEQQPHGPA